MQQLSERYHYSFNIIPGRFPLLFCVYEASFYWRLLYPAKSIYQAVQTKYYYVVLRSTTVAPELCGDYQDTAGILFGAVGTYTYPPTMTCWCILSFSRTRGTRSRNIMHDSRPQLSHKRGRVSVVDLLSI